MTVKVIQCDHKKRLDGYLTVLKRLADKWGEDISDLKRINEISKEEVRAEAEVLDTFGYLIEEVHELSKEAEINDGLCLKKDPTNYD